VYSYLSYYLDISILLYWNFYRYYSFNLSYDLLGYFSWNFIRFFNFDRNWNYICNSIRIWYLFSIWYTLLYIDCKMTTF